jgi:hypothetical protein
MPIPAATILGIVYAVLATGRPFDELAITYFDRHDAEHVRRRLTRRLEATGRHCRGMGRTITDFRGTG